MAVVYPRSTEQVSVIARICHKYHVPIIGYSGGTSLEGHFSAPYGGISVDFAYMVRMALIHWSLKLGIDFRRYSRHVMVHRKLTGSE